MEDVISQLEATIQARKEVSPKESYTASLFEAGIVRVAQKVGEEGVEVALAAVIGKDPHLVSEMADLVYHCLVLLASRDLNWNQVENQLASRFQKGGLPEE